MDGVEGRGTFGVIQQRGADPDLVPVIAKDWGGGVRSPQCTRGLNPRYRVDRFSTSERTRYLVQWGYVARIDPSLTTMSGV